MPFFLLPGGEKVEVEVDFVAFVGHEWATGMGGIPVAGRQKPGHGSRKPGREVGERSPRIGENLATGRRNLATDRRKPDH